MRVINRILAIAAALCLAAGGLLVAVEIAWAGLGQRPWLIPYDDWYTDARTNRWDSSPGRSLFLALTLAGVILLAVSWSGPAPGVFPSRTARPTPASRGEAWKKRWPAPPAARTEWRRPRPRSAAAAFVSGPSPGALREISSLAWKKPLDGAYRTLGVNGHLELAVQVERKPK